MSCRDFLACPHCSSKLQDFECGYLKCCKCDCEYPLTPSGVALIMEYEEVASEFNLSNERLDWIPEKNYSEDVVSSAYQKLRNDKLYDKLKGYSESLGRKLNVVDVGCGDPYKSDSYMAPLWPLVETYVGIDPSHSRVSKIACSDDIGIATGVGEKLPIVSEVADVVTLFSVLSHCSSPEQVLQEVFRSLKEGGHVVIYVNNRLSWYKRLAWWKARSLEQKYSSIQPNVFTAQSMKEVLGKVGFQQIYLESFFFIPSPNLMSKLARYLFPDDHLTFYRRIDGLGKLLLPSSGGRLIITATKKSN